MAAESPRASVALPSTEQKQEHERSPIPDELGVLADVVQLMLDKQKADLTADFKDIASTMQPPSDRILSRKFISRAAIVVALALGTSRIIIGWGGDEATSKTEDLQTEVGSANAELVEANRHLTNIEEYLAVLGPEDISALGPAAEAIPGIEDQLDDLSALLGSPAPISERCNGFSPDQLLGERAVGSYCRGPA